MENVNDKIIDKINKLLARANCDGSSETERETALRQAYKLLALHNMTLESVQQEQNPRELISQDGHGMNWSRDIASAVARLFFCKYLFCITKTNRCEHMFVGKRSNAVVAMELANYLINSTFREGSKRMKTENPMHPYAWRMDFGKGTAAAISDRCYLLRKQQEDEMDLDGEKQAGTEMVLADFYKVELELNQKWIEEHMKVRRSTDKSRDPNFKSAFNAGRDFGDKLPLAGGITDNRKSQRRIAAPSK